MSCNTRPTARCTCGCRRMPGFRLSHSRRGTRCRQRGRRAVARPGCCLGEEHMPLDQATRTTRSKRLPVPAMSEAERVTAVAPEQSVRVTRPRLKEAVIHIVGVSPYLQNAFPAKARLKMEETQRAGQQARGKKVREPKDFDASY